MTTIITKIRSRHRRVQKIAAGLQEDRSSWRNYGDIRNTYGKRTFEEIHGHWQGLGHVSPKFIDLYGRPPAAGESMRHSRELRSLIADGKLDAVVDTGPNGKEFIRWLVLPAPKKTTPQPEGRERKQVV